MVELIVQVFIGIVTFVVLAPVVIIVPEAILLFILYLISRIG